MRNLAAVPVLALFAMIAASPPISAQALMPDDSAMTTARLVERLRATAGDIMESACPGLHDQAKTAIADLVVLADRLETAFEDEPEASLEGLEGRLRDSAGQGTAALIVADGYVKAMRACVIDDLELLLRAFRENMQRAAGEPESWSSGRARILRALGEDGSAVAALRAGTARSISIEGLNLDAHSCGAVEATLTRAGEEPVAAATTHTGDGRIAVAVPALEESGLYDLSVRLPRRRFLFFCGSTRASFALPVHSATPFRVRYTVSTTTSEVRTITWNAGELKRANESCDRDTVARTLFRLPDGWTYDSHEWIVFLNSRAEKRAEAVRDNEVLIEYRVPHKTGPFCTGAASLIHGKMVMHGTRTHTAPGPAIEREGRRPLGFGESMAVPVRVEAPEGAAVAEWSIDVRFLYPDGSERRIPVKSGAGRLAGSEPGGGSFSWDPESRRLTFSAPAQMCWPESAPGAAGRSRSPMIRER